MNNKLTVKISSLILLISILLSIFSIPVFAEEETKEADEEYTFWEDLEMMGVLILGAMLSPILTLANWLHELFGFAPLI